LVQARGLLREQGKASAQQILNPLGIAGVANAILIKHKLSGKGILFLGGRESEKAAAAALLIEGASQVWGLLAHWETIFLLSRLRPQRFFAIQTALGLKFNLEWWSLVPDPSDPRNCTYMRNQTEIKPTGEPTLIDAAVWFGYDSTLKNITIEPMQEAYKLPKHIRSDIMSWLWPFDASENIDILQALKTLPLPVVLVKLPTRYKLDRISQQAAEKIGVYIRESIGASSPVESAGLDEIIRLFKINHPDWQADIKIIQDIYEIVSKEYAKKQFFSGESYLDHATSVAVVVASWKADARTIAISLLHKMEADKVKNILSGIDYVSLSEVSAIAGIISDLEKLRLPYLGKEIVSLKTETTLQNYMKRIVISLKGDSGALLHLFADKLQAVYVATEEEKKIRARELFHIYIPLAGCLMPSIYTKLQDYAFKLSDPDQYEATKQQIETWYGDYDALDQVPEKLEEDLIWEELVKKDWSLGILNRIVAMVDPKAKTAYRKKGIFSIFEKVKSSQTRYTEPGELEDLQGGMAVTDKVIEAGSKITAFLTSRQIGYKTEWKQRRKLGYQALHINFFHSKTGPWEIILMSERDYDLYRFGMHNTIFAIGRLSEPHWLYKLKRLLKEENMPQVFEAANLCPADNFPDNCRTLYDNLAEKIYIPLIQPVHRGYSLSVIELPQDARPIDVALHPQINLRIKDYHGLSLVQYEPGKTIKIMDDNIIAEDKPLTSGMILAFSRKSKFTLQPEYIYRNAQLLRSKVLLRAELEKKSIEELAKEGEKKITQGIRISPEILDTLTKFLKLRGLRLGSQRKLLRRVPDRSELYAALELGIIGTQEVIDYCKTKTKITMYVHVQNIEGITVQIMGILTKSGFEFMNIRVPPPELEEGIIVFENLYCPSHMTDAEIRILLGGFEGVITAAEIVRQSGSPVGSSPVASQQTRTVSITAGFNKKVSLTLAWGDLDDNTPLALRWRELTRGHPVYYTQQASLKPTYIGIAGQDQWLTREFLKESILGGLLWKASREKNVLVILKQETAEVYLEEKATLDQKLTEQASVLFGEVRKDAEARTQKLTAQAAWLAELAKTPFFTRRIPALEPANDKVPFSFAAGNVKDSERWICVYGNIEQKEAEDLVKELQFYRYKSLGASGNVFIKFHQDTIDVEIENDVKQAREDILDFIRGFCDTVAVSDTHIATKGGEDNYGGDKELEFIRILERAIARRSKVVVNGDFLELWQAKYGDIRHSYALLFATLRKMRRIIYVAGNHDESILQEVINRVRYETMEIAKANVVTNTSEIATFEKLLEDPIVNKKIRTLAAEGYAFILSRGFQEEAIALDEKTFYLDRTLLDVVKRHGQPMAASRFKKLIEDIQQSLNEAIQGDLGRVEIVKYYLDALRGLYFEHGNKADVFNYETKTGRIITWVVGKLEELGWESAEHDLNWLKDNAISVAGIFAPKALVAEVRNSSERVLAAGSLLRWYIGPGVLSVPVTIFFGHTHVTVDIGQGPINAFSRAFLSSDYANTGTWSKAAEKKIRPSPKWRQELGLETKREVPAPQAVPSKDDAEERKDGFTITAYRKIHYWNGEKGYLAAADTASSPVERPSDESIKALEGYLSYALNMPMRYGVVKNSARQQDQEVAVGVTNSYLRVGDIIILAEPWAESMARGLWAEAGALIVETPLMFLEYLVPIIALMLEQDMDGVIAEEYGTGKGDLALVAFRLGARQLIGIDGNEKLLFKAEDVLNKAGYGPGRILQAGEWKYSQPREDHRFYLMHDDLNNWFAPQNAQLLRKWISGRSIRLANVGPYYPIHDALTEHVMSGAYPAIVGGYNSEKHLLGMQADIRDFHEGGFNVQSAEYAVADTVYWAIMVSAPEAADASSPISSSSRPGRAGQDAGLPMSFLRLLLGMFQGGWSIDSGDQVKDIRKGLLKGIDALLIKDDVYKARIRQALEHTVVRRGPPGYREPSFHLANPFTRTKTIYLRDKAPDSEILHEFIISLGTLSSEEIILLSGNYGSSPVAAITLDFEAGKIAFFAGLPLETLNSHKKWKSALRLIAANPKIGAPISRKHLHINGVSIMVRAYRIPRAPISYILYLLTPKDGVPCVIDLVQGRLHKRATKMSAVWQERIRYIENSGKEPGKQLKPLSLREIVMTLLEDVAEDWPGASTMRMENGRPFLLMPVALAKIRKAFLDSGYGVRRAISKNSRDAIFSLRLNGTVMGRFGSTGHGTVALSPHRIKDVNMTISLCDVIRNLRLQEAAVSSFEKEERVPFWWMAAFLAGYYGEAFGVFMRQNKSHGAASSALDGSSSEMRFPVEPWESVQEAVTVVNSLVRHLEKTFPEVGRIKTYLYGASLPGWKGKPECALPYIHLFIDASSKNAVARRLYADLLEYQIGSLDDYAASSWVKFIVSFNDDGVDWRKAYEIAEVIR
ncbi:MAG: HD domain-containing protein, partial [Deltaproteobacteria bacterium]